jgi:hypothetical protein
LLQKTVLTPELPVVPIYLPPLNTDATDEKAWLHSAEEMLGRIRNSPAMLSGMRDGELKESIVLFKADLTNLNRVMRRPTNPEEASLMKDRTALRDKLNLVVGILEAELKKRTQKQTWNY